MGGNQSNELGAAMDDLEVAQREVDDFLTQRGLDAAT
jgi:hypothetical protein